MSNRIQEEATPSKDPKYKSGKLDREFASRHLLAHKAHILERWESEVRRQIPESYGKSSLVLSNTLPLFIEELAKFLEQEQPQEEMISVRGMSKYHGAKRASLPGYFIPQLLLEFSILRQVINEELFEIEILSYEVPLTVDKVIDSAISLSTTEFARVQSEGIKSALERAEASNRDLEEFASVAAHDLKAPLGTVTGFLDLLTENLELGKDSEDAKNIEFMSAALKRMTSLIDQLLDYAHIGGKKVNLQRVELSEILDTAIQNLQENIQKSGTQIQHESLPVILGDNQLLTQVFQNLLANSIKFHGTKSPEIFVSAESQKEFWQIKIKDNGIGFDPKFKNQIFGLYKRLSTSSKTSGTGIGLATCRKVIDLHGGKIWCDSEPGKGSTFYFTIPKIAESEHSH